MYLIYQWTGITPRPTTISWVPIGLKVSDIIYPTGAKRTEEQEKPTSKAIQSFDKKFSDEIRKIRPESDNANRTQEKSEDITIKEGSTSDSPKGALIKQDEVETSEHETTWRWFNIPSNNVRVLSPWGTKFSETLTYEPDDMDKGWFHCRL